jgi:hypothetical protein
MTPKEKARELVYKYEYLVKTWDCYNDEPLEIKYKLKGMKDSALIAVDEILNSNPHSNPLTTDLGVSLPLYDYWKEVKQEIEKL